MSAMNGEHARLASIDVKGLFGRFSHHVDLCRPDRITIIHGRNGTGKTSLLRIVSAALSARLVVLSDEPFDSVRLDFDTKTSLTIQKKNSKCNDATARQDSAAFGDSHLGTTHATHSNLDFQQSRRGKVVETWNGRSYVSPERNPALVGFLERQLPELVRVDSDAWIYTPTQQRMSLADVLDRFMSRIPPYLRNMQEQPPKWLVELGKECPVQLIETQRLQRYIYEGVRGRTSLGTSNSYGSGRPWLAGRPDIMPAVDADSQELSELLHGKQAEYGAKSQSLDQTFPERVVTREAQNILSKDRLQKELRKVFEQRGYLADVGLLPNVKEDETALKYVKDEDRRLLTVYLEDTREKLQVLDDLAERISLLVKIINSRFDEYKRMKVSEKGFVFRTRDGRELQPSELSSGEQHELVLFYELLFRTPDGALVLIDEPELSLHVDWQDKFIGDLQEIANMRDYNCIVATHSPDIIGSHWDWTVQLNGDGR